MKKIIFIFGLMFYFTAHANLTLLLQLESQLQSKLRMILEPLDSSAQVNVNVKFKKVNIELPGGGFQAQDITLTKDGSSVNLSDLETVQVEIYSQLEVLPPDTINLIKAAIPLPQQRLKINFKSGSNKKNSAALADEVKLLRESVMTYFEKVNNLANRFFWVYLLVAIGIGTGLGYIGYSFYELVKDHFQKGLNAENRPQPMDFSAQQAVTQRPAESASSSTAASISQNDFTVSHLSSVSLVNLFSDCYWCNEDAYAHWLWKNTTLNQRTIVLQEWSTATEYIRSVANIKSEFKSFHDDPFYLQPSSMAALSQEDLVKQLKKNSDLWAQVSPIRRLHLPLPLAERVKFLTLVETPSKNPVLIPAIKSSLRILTISVNIGEVTLADEDSILENPNLIPQAFQSQIKSLVWLALLPESNRGKILSQFSAMDLASVWIGSDNVMQKLKQTLPSKKLDMIESYVKNSQPRRDGPVLQSLVQLCFQNSLDTQELKSAA